MKVLKLNHNVITGSEYVWVEVPDEVVSATNQSALVYNRNVQTKLKLLQKSKRERKK